MDLGMDSRADIILTGRAKLKLFVQSYWQSIVILVTPIILLPVVLVHENNTAYKALYIFLITVTFWITDVWPGCVTSLIPIVFSPLLQVMSSDQVCQNFLRNGLMNCVGSMMFITAMQYSGLHKRLALKFMLIIGCSHYALSFCLFFLTMFMSMWISNTTVVGIMLPIVSSILQILDTQQFLNMYQQSGLVLTTVIKHEVNTIIPMKITVFYFLGITYSATIGGISSLFGSSSNLLFKYFSETTPIDFPIFMLYSIPGMLVMECVLYLWLNISFNGMFRPNSPEAARAKMEGGAQYLKSILSIEYAKLGPITFHETIVCFLLLIIIVMHALLLPGYMDGHENGFKMINSSTPALMAVFILFCLPVNLNFLQYFKRRVDKGTLLEIKKIGCLNWSLLARETPWAVFLLLGGSNVLIETWKRSGLLTLIGQRLISLSNWPQSLILIMITLLCTVISQFAPSETVVNAFLPMVAHVALHHKINPQYLLLAATISSSFAFHLPCGSASNAMAATYGKIPTWTMICVGFRPTIITMIVNWISLFVWIRPSWPSLLGFPNWASELSNDTKEFSWFEYGGYTKAYN